MWRFVVVALVVEASSKSEENIWCVHVFVVVVPNTSESVPVVVMGPPVIGYVVVILVTVPEPPTAGVEVAISNPFGSTARNVPAGVPSEVSHTELVAVNCDVPAFPKFCRAVHQCVAESEGDGSGAGARSGYVARKGRDVVSCGLFAVEGRPVCGREAA